MGVRDEMARADAVFWITRISRAGRREALPGYLAAAKAEAEAFP